MNLLTDRITPFEGTEHIKLYVQFTKFKQFLEDNSINYTVEVWKNSECTVPMPWNIIHIGSEISLFFANDKLFKIVAFEGYAGTLNNGIKIGMPIDVALKTDSTLHYDDWNEDYEAHGYWLEESAENTVSSISVFISEVLDDGVFEKYKW